MNSNLKKLCVSALCVALAMVLDMIKIIPLPFGGAVTPFMMLALSIPGFYFGLGYGFMTSQIMPT